jgi:hypothetical protein
MSTDDRNVEFRLPEPEETARLIAEARRLRAEAFAGLVRSTFGALRRVFAGEAEARPARA